jgi:hypothetical protein
MLTRRHKPEHFIFHSNRCDKLKFYTMELDGYSTLIFKSPGNFILYFSDDYRFLYNGNFLKNTNSSLPNKASICNYMIIVSNIGRQVAVMNENCVFLLLQIQRKF